MREPVANFLVGLTSIVALAALAVLLFLFGELDELVNPRYAITINTDHAVGLRRGSGVELNGVPIGQIDRVEVREHAEYRVRVVALIDEGIAIPATAVPYAATSLLGGAAVLEIEAAARAGSETLRTDGLAVINSPIKFRVIEQITRELDARMTPIMEALAKFEELAGTYAAFGEQLNDLLTPQSDDALAAGAAPNVRTTVARLAVVLEETAEAVALAREWLSDEQLRAGARDAVTKASTLIDRATETLARFEEVAAAIEGDGDELVKALRPVADEISLTLEEVRRLSRLAADGEGTIGLLLRNPDLYRSLDDAARRLEEAVREAKLLMEKIKAEGLPINL